MKIFSQERDVSQACGQINIDTISFVLRIAVLILVTSFTLAFAALPPSPNQLTIPFTQILLLAFLLLVSGFLSGAETSFTAIGQWKIRELSEKGHPIFAKLLQDPTRFITTCLMGSNLANIGATVLITQIAISLAIGLQLNQNVVVTLTTGLMTVLVLIFGEITPKALAVHHPETVARGAARSVYYLAVIFYPVGLAFTYIASSVLRLFGLESRDNPLVTANELRMVVRSAGESGIIHEEGQDMIRGILEFEETVVREVMTPRVDVVALAHTATLAEVHTLLEERVLSRIPVYEETLDNIVGVFYIRDLFKYLYHSDTLSTTTVAERMQPPHYVPETLAIMSLLRDMRQQKNHMAIVVDEYGGTAGIVTLEDLIEEITGEIYDETDIPEVQDIEDLGDSYKIQASVHLDEVADTLAVVFDDDGDYDTLAGFLISRFGYIPVEGESLDHAQYNFEVIEADERRIVCVRVTSSPDEEDGSENSHMIDGVSTSDGATYDSQ